MKSLLKVLLSKMGYRLVPANLDSQSAFLGLQNLTFKSVVDVGANKGSTVEKWLKAFPEADVYAFEPVPSTFAGLNALYGGNRRVSLFNMAAGAKDEPVEINVHLDHASSSSILRSTDLSKEMIPSTTRSEAVTVIQKTLDTVLVEGSIVLREPIFIKLDVQGYEKQVLDGARKLLEISTAVLTEVTIPVLYSGQANFNEIHDRLTAAGLSFYGFYEQFHSDDGRPVYADVIYVRN